MHFVCHFICFYTFWPRAHTKAIKRRFRIEKKKPSRKQRLIVLMRTGKKEDSQKRWRQSLWHLYRRNRRTLVCRLACEQALPGVRGCGREKGKIWLVSFWQLNTRGAIGGSGGGIQIYQTPVQGLKEKEREGFIKPNWCGRVLRLSILCYYIVLSFLYGLRPACRVGMHALQEKNMRHKPGLGHVL